MDVRHGQEINHYDPGTKGGHCIPVDPPRDHVDRSHNLGQPARDTKNAGRKGYHHGAHRLEKVGLAWVEPGVEKSGYDGNTSEAVGVVKP